MKKSCYIRITGGTNNPIIYDKNYNFEIGKAIKLKNGEDVVIFGSGSVLDECLKVAELLEEKKFQQK